MTFKQVLSYFLTGAAVLSVTTTTLAAEDLLHDNADGAADAAGPDHCGRSAGAGGAGHAAEFQYGA